VEANLFRVKVFGWRYDLIVIACIPCMVEGIR